MIKKETSGNNPQISVILPCLNEEQAIGLCLEKIISVIKIDNLKAEIIVVDNGSTDNSCKIAIEKQARLVYEKQAGYGAACLKGFEAAQGDWLFLADSDGSYDFGEIPRFIAELKKGYDFIIGNRFKGKIAKGAMSWLHRRIGSPLLSGILRLLFKMEVYDTHCGMRAITKKALEKLELKTAGMEFASEMIIMAGKKRLKIKELPINYYKRLGSSKLKSFADGWRHLRFMLLYSPLFLFFLPGAVLFLSGASLMLWMYFSSPVVFGLKLYFHPMFLAALLIIAGYQLITFALFAKTYSITHLKDKPIFEKFYKYVTIENASIAGILIALLGLVIYLAICIKWVKAGFSALNEIKNSIAALTLVTIGIQTIFSSFMLSILGIKEK